MKISIFAFKGGVGKTLVALNLAGALSEQGQKVLVVDLDPHGSALAWASLSQAESRETAFVVSRSVSRGFDTVIYDHSPYLRSGEGLMGDVVVVPTYLDASSFRGLIDTRTLIEKQELSAIYIANRFRADRKEQRDVLASFPDMLTIKDRACYPLSYGKGLTVFDNEIAVRNTHLARTEITNIVEQINLIKKGN